ncbi:MAG: hypothetical protein U0793_15930 [Gemmataceae bacterium]
MPRRSDGEKIDELERIVATLIERVDNVREDADTVPDLSARVAVLEEKVA